MNTREFLMNTAFFGALGTATSFANEKSETAPRVEQLKDFFNVKDFGAKGNGRQADSPAIQRAIDAAAESGGTVWFPTGTYRCHDLKLKAAVKLKAEPLWGYAGTYKTAVLLLDSDDAECIVDATGAVNSHICGLLFFGNRKSRKTKRPVHGLMCDRKDSPFAKNCETIVVEDCKFHFMSGHGIYMNKIFAFIIRRCLSALNGGSGVKIFGWDGYVCDSIFAGNLEHGFGSFNIGASIMFTHNRVEWNKKYGVYIGPKGDYWTLTGNQFDHNWGSGICVDGGENISVNGNSFRRNGRGSQKCLEGENSAHIALCNASGVSIVGNNFMAKKSDGNKEGFTPKFGIWTKDSKFCNISSNNFYRGYMTNEIFDAGGNRDNQIFGNTGCVLTNVNSK